MKFKSILFILILCLSSCKKEDVSLLKSESTAHTENWMQDLLVKYSNETVTLKDICLPRAHDAGVYVLNNCNGGNDCNTKTQDKSIGVMLKSGIRVFDVRPTIINGEYWTYHRTSCGGLGCEGVFLSTLLEETREYLDEHNELVIFEMNNLCNTGSQDPGLMALINQILGERIFKLNGPLSTSFIDTDLKGIIPAYNNSGKIILLWNGVSVASSTPQDGIFPRSFIPYSGSYANSPDIDIAVNDQLQKFSNYNATDNALFRFSYTFTLNAGLAITCLSNTENATSIEDIALDGREQLPSRIDNWISNGTVTKTKIPNILSVDFCNTVVTEQCIKLSEFSLE